MKCCASFVVLLACAAARAQTSQPAPATQASTQPTTQPISSLGGPTLVTLHLEKVSAKEAFDRLEQVSKQHLPTAQPQLLARTDDKSISVDFQQKPYLQAMLELCREANLQINVLGGRLMLLPAPDHQQIPPHSSGGPIETICSNLAQIREIQYGQHDATTSQASMSFSLISEERFPISGVEPLSVKATAVDDRGMTLEMVDSPKAAQLQMGSAFAESRAFWMRFAIDPTATHSIASLRGSVIARVITKSDTMTVNDLLNAEGSSVQFAGSTFNISKIEAMGAPGQFQVDIEVKSQTLTPNFFSRLQFAADTPFMPRSDGPPNLIRVSRVQPAADGTLVSLLVANAAGPNGQAAKPVTLIWKLPSEVQRVQVPFEFRDMKIR